MSYLLALPGLLCGLALCAHDLNRRTVPRLWVLAGISLQLLALAMRATVIGDWSLVLLPAAYGLAAGTIQFLLSYVAPGSLGFGDVTCSCMMGITVGLFGLDTFLLWWLAMGLVGCLWIAVWPRLQRPHHPLPADSDDGANEPIQEGMSSGTRKVPFVPVIVIAAMAAIALS